MKLDALQTHMRATAVRTDATMAALADVLRATGTPSDRAAGV